MCDIGIAELPAGEAEGHSLLPRGGELHQI